VTATGTLVLLRHGESEWNKANLFTGWVDVPLSDKGRQEAARGGQLLAEHGLLPDVLHTSVLKRAISTAELALAEADRQWIPVRRSWRLNERHYGALQGSNKADAVKKFGEAQVKQWRRGYATPPPPVDTKSPDYPRADPRYADVADADLPRSESLKDVLERVLPYWRGAIVPQLRDGRRVLIVAHGNSLRALMKHLENIVDDAIADVNLPTGIPRVYRLDADWKAVEARFLGNAAEIAAKIDSVQKQTQRA